MFSLNQNSTFQRKIKFLGETIETTFTSNSETITTWIEESVYRTDAELVALDVVWRPEILPNVANKAATLQFCVNKKCIIIQLLYLDEIPQSLREFLINPNLIFVGFKILDHLKKLKSDHGLCYTTNFVDVLTISNDHWPGTTRNRPGLKNIALDLCKIPTKKPLDVVMIDWESMFLTDAQVKHACIDASASYRLGYKVLAGFF